MILQELAITHGTANVHVKGHAKQRQAEYRRIFRSPATASGKANLKGWQQLADAFEHGFGTVQRGGERLVASA
jgi:hypothetical protein